MDILSDLTGVCTRKSLRETLKSFCAKKNIGYKEDAADNIIIHAKSATGGSDVKKIMVPIVLNCPELSVTNVTNDNKAYFKASCNIEPKALKNRKVLIDGKQIGIIRTTKTSKDKTENYIEILNGSTVKIGEICELESNTTCKGNMLYGFGSSVIAPLISMLHSIDFNKIHENDIYFTISFSDVYAESLEKNIDPNYIFYIYSAECNDNFKFSDGCGIVFKDGNFVAAPRLREFITRCADGQGIKYSPYFGKQSKLAEKLSLSAPEANTAAICILIKYMNTYNEIACTADIFAAGELLACILKI